MRSALLFCGNDVHSREVWAEKTNSTVATAIRTIIVLIMSFFMVLIVGSLKDIATVFAKTGFSGAVGDCNERVLALLFPRDPARRREQGCAHRQIEHDIDDTSGVYLVERARFVAAKCMRLYDCRGHVYDD